MAWREDRRGWGFTALLIVLVAHGYRYATWQIKDAHTYSDGYYSWLFARSLAFDFDVDSRTTTRSAAIPSVSVSTRGEVDPPIRSTSAPRSSSVPSCGWSSTS